MVYIYHYIYGIYNGQRINYFITLIDKRAMHISKQFTKKKKKDQRKKKKEEEEGWKRKNVNDHQ